MGSDDEPDPSELLARLTAALCASGDVAYDWDLSTDAIRWQGSIERLFSGEGPVRPPETGDDLGACVHPKDHSQRSGCLNDHLATGEAYDCEFRIVVGPGIFHWVHDRGAVLRDGDRNPRLVGTMRLIDSRKEAEAQITYIATHDELTGHFNKQRLEAAVDETLRLAVRNGTTGGFAVLGVDQLALINRAYGYQAGDAVLKAVGSRLADCIRGSDVIGRIGSDRFGLLLSRCNPETARRASERAVDAINREPVATPSGLVRITVTAGVVTFPSQAAATADIFAKAEGVLREAKSQGRDHAGVYEMSEPQRDSDREALDMGGEVEAAMREGRIHFAYQPVLWTDDGGLCFHECLLRMSRPDGEVLTAGRFVPAIEKLGLMRAVEHEVLRMAAEQLQSGRTGVLAINISGLTTGDPKWLQELTRLLGDRPDLADRLIIEITETAALRDIDETARFVTTVRELGARVALDDFGAGFTNFQHLKALKVDIVKIDGSFVRGVDRDVHNRLFVRNLITLATSLDMLCIAECVETSAEAKVLREEGAPLVQGYYYGKPSLVPPWETEAAGEAGQEPLIAGGRSVI